MTALIPVTLVTGFLGSGKTTLLNRLLHEGHLADAALVINEFGDVGIDHLLVETADEALVEMADGCICCTIRGDLVDTLLRLLERSASGAPMRRIVIETTGLADPAPILHAIMGHPALVDLLRLDGVVTLVDAVNGMATLDAHEEAVKQVAVADRLLITKTDLTAETDPLRARLQRLNPNALTVDLSKSLDLPGTIFDCGLFNPETKSAGVNRWLKASESNHHDHHHHHDVNRHDAAIRARTLVADKPVSLIQLASFIDLLRSAHGPKLLRVKGIVAVAEHPDRPVVIHGVQNVFHPPATLPAWPDDDHRTHMVFITRNMDDNYIGKLFDALMGTVRTDTPDRQSLEDNPLAIPGMGRFSG